MPDDTEGHVMQQVSLPSFRTGLLERKRQYEDALFKINAALDALDRCPQAEEVIEILRSAGA